MSIIATTNKRTLAVSWLFLATCLGIYLLALVYLASRVAALAYLTDKGGDYELTKSLRQSQPGYDNLKKNDTT